MPRDHRTYITVHDGLPDHPKIEPLTDKAFRLLIESWCYSSRHLTDGVIPAAAWVRRGTPKARAELVASGLVLVTDDGSAALHDYSEHQRTREEVAQAVAKKKVAGALGNHKRHHVSAGQSNPECEHCIAETSQVRTSRDHGATRKTSPESETETESDTEKYKNPPSTPSRVPPAAASRGSRLPDDFPVTEVMRLWAAENAPSAGTRDHDDFCDYWHAKAGKDATKVDWVATWRKWMRKASDERGSSRAPGRPGPTTPIERAAGVAEMAARVAARQQTHLRAIGDH